jgi:[pyruvate, water dikinase]-phosphate phosphotransferase / [pyruvate, water dikinase] kinase
MRKAVASISRGVILHGFVEQGLKDAVTKECASKGLQAWDVTGPTVRFLQQATGAKPVADSGAIHSVNTNYMKRMQALEYALQHDDSRRSDRLEEADIILVGISRVSKTPNASFLGYQGFRVANVTLVPAQGLPRSLQRHRKKNVAALTIQPRRLVEIRTKRFADWELERFDYTDLHRVIREVMEAEEIYRKKGWPIINTTELAVEETSALVLAKLGMKPKFSK